MNKQELASLIWDYCNGLRGSISTVEYKDFILGFIFYRFLSEKEISHLKKQRWSDNNIKDNLNEKDQETVEQCKNDLGYFIGYSDLFSTWKTEASFDISNISEALDRFSRNINSNHLPLYDGIFKSLSDKLPKLGVGNEAKSHIRKIVNVVNQIPMDGKQGYDVLGYIYEYLLANFASNAGKKDGEFYTPHEISVLMSEIVAHHLKDRDTINIFDPTSGSGSLLINIGQSLQKYMHSHDNIIYYAQEKIEDTYNLTRMNLIMRGINPDNLFVRCANTLKEDWPYIDYNNSYKYVPVDCVVSNPPYSQKWDSNENDPRYRQYGIAPASKADYAFLLHDLYHLKDDGIMCIVLPHGVLFRGGTEKDIRQNLIENNNIETIIGLPANIFYGTGIPTIIMVLKKHRANGDILFIDASQEYIKEGSKNKLAGYNVKKIVDATLSRDSIPFFSKLVSKEIIKNNDYNLNIPRYISSTKESMPYDLYSTMFGNLPTSEIDQFGEWWLNFPTLRSQLFYDENRHISKVKVESFKQAINDNLDIINFKESYKNRFSGFDDEIFEILLNKNANNIHQLKTEIITLLFSKCSGLILIDKYQIYRAFDNAWTNISIDVEMINARGNLSICREIEDIEVYDKKSKETITKGQQGKILPFELILKELYKNEYKLIEEKRNILIDLENDFNSCFEDIDSELKTEILKSNDKDDKEEEIDFKKLKEKYQEIINSIFNNETKILEGYLRISKEKEKLDYQMSHSSISWPTEDQKGVKGTYSKSVILNLINNLRNVIEMDEDEEDYKIRKLYLLSLDIASAKKEIKSYNNQLDKEVICRITQLSEDEIRILLKEKWVAPVIKEINLLPNTVVNGFIASLNGLIKKYDNPLAELENRISTIEKELVPMIDGLEGDEFDVEGLNELKKMLGGY